MYPQLGNQAWITSYGLVFAVALVTCWWLARRNAGTEGLDPGHIDLLLPLTVAIALVAGAMMGSGVRLIPFLFIGSVVVAVYSRLARQSFRSLVDILATPVIVAIMIQRIGCFLAGCCWGDAIVNAGWAWAGVSFPAGSFAWEQQLAAGLVNADAPVSLPVHATQLYEAVLLAPVALSLRKAGLNRYPPGFLALMAVAAYAAVRFGIEFLRADSATFATGMTAVQLQCVALLMTAFWFHARSRG